MCIRNKQSFESYYKNFTNQLNGEQIENMTLRTNQIDSINQAYKDLSNRLALLTIYRDVERDSQQNKATLINENISLFANYQTLLHEKKDLAVGLQKFSIKHINTSPATNSQFFYESKLMENNQLLQKYLIEAADKQAEGIVNNVLIMIQQTENGEEKQQNFFSYAVANQIQESKKVGFGKEKKKENKIVFINLTGRESQWNLNNWNSILSGEEEYLYFSFTKMGDVQKMESEFQKQFDAMNYPPYCKQFIFPYVCDENGKLMKGDYIRSLFDLFIYNKIQKLHQLEYIALSLEISDDIEYELNGLQYLIQTLMKLSNDKLIVHINVRNNCQDQNFEVKLAQGMNQCYIAFFTDQLNLNENMTIDEKLLIAKYLDQTSYFYKKINLASEYCGLLQRKRANLLSSTNSKINSYNQYQDNKEQDAIFYKINDNQTAIIIPKIGEHRLTKQTEVYIDYDEEIIIIYYNQNHKGNGAYLFYAEVKREIFNQIKLNYELQFSEIQMDFEINQLCHPILFYKQQCIYIMYGLRNDSLNEILYIYQLQQKKWKQLEYEDKQNKCDFLSQKIYPELRCDYIKKIENRVRPTVCFGDKKNSENLCALFFGGENIKSFEIMNLTEYVEIGETSYYSILIGKQNLYKDLSFRPFSHQLILQAQKESTSYFLFLNGNNDLSLRKENSITNYSINDQAILLAKSSNNAQFKKLTVKYLDEHYFKIDKFNNIQKNIKFITNIGDLFFWRVLFSEDIIDDSQYSKLAKMQIYQKSKDEKGSLVTEMEVIKLMLLKSGSQDSLQQQEQNMEVENIKREQFIIQKYQIIQNKKSDFGLLKLQTLKTKIAFENYICVDSKNLKIFIKQYQYQLLDSIKGQINDMDENQFSLLTESQGMSAVFICQNSYTNSVSNIEYGTIEEAEKKSKIKQNVLDF